MRIGGMFEGYGGLSMSARAVIGGEAVWFAENDLHASRILAHHWPGVPNHGDVAAIDWTTVEPVDVLCAGWPCQDISHAGRRAGIEGERSGLWSHVVDACRVLRPRYLLAENVAALVVRGLDRILADLATLGFAAEWACLRASDIGAPHRRERWFLVAAADSTHVGHQRPGGTWRRRHRSADRRTPVADATGDRRNERWSEYARLQRRPDAAERRAAAADTDRDRREVIERHEPGMGTRRHADGRGPLRWGQYTPAIQRWEHLLGRPAPDPTVTGQRGGRVLNPRFVEWLMGLDAGHVTDVPGLTRNAQLRALGNGVVPQQGTAAFRDLLARLDSGEAAA